MVTPTTLPTVDLLTDITSPILTLLSQSSSAPEMKLLNKSFNTNDTATTTKPEKILTLNVSNPSRITASHKENAIDRNRTIWSAASCSKAAFNANLLLS